MRILLTNDDGIDAPGLSALEEAVAGLGSSIVVAPKEPQSGVGHRVTTHAPIAIQRLGEARVSVDGTPADCVRVALGALSAAADWVLAGINHGGNLGADAYISGTIAATREAALHGFPAIAISQYVARGRPVDWTLSARRARRAIERILEEPVERGSFWSVNLPHPETDSEDLETVFCALDPSPLLLSFRQEGDHLHYAGDYHDRPRLPGRDVDVCFSGRIAVTRIPLDLER